MADEADKAEEVSSQEQAPHQLFAITVLLPDAGLPAFQVQASGSETVNEIKQSIIEQPSTCQYSCFHLEHNGKVLSDYAELGAIEGLEEKADFKLVQDPYTERDARMHVSRFVDFLHGGAAPTPGGETHFELLQQSEAAEEPMPLTGDRKDRTANAHDLAPKPRTSVVACLKQIALSAWNPVPADLRLRGQLFYLVATTLEGDVVHITASIGGFYISNTTASKFDPSMRQGAEKHHALLSLLSKQSPLFKAHYAKLETYMNTRDAILTVPLTNAAPAQSWLAQKQVPSSDPLRVQRPFLEHGFDSNETLRDWNEEIQTTRELPTSPLPERILRSRLLAKTLFDFSAAAAKGAELLVKGELAALNPMDERDAQMYIYGNIFFSHGLDGVGTFYREGGDEAARKAVALDVRGVKALATLDVDKLHTLGTCVVDYCGERIVAQSIVPGIFKQRPENESQIIYGGVDGRDVVADNEACGVLFGKVAQAMRLRRHAVFEKEEDRRKELELSIETKGLAGADGRTYILDLYRLTPVDVRFLEQDCIAEETGSYEERDTSKVSEESDKYPHRMVALRYELVEGYWETKLNAYVEEKMQQEDKEAAEKKASEAPASSTEEPQALADQPADKAEASEEVAKKHSASDSTDTDGFTQVAAEGEASNGEEPSKERRIDISGFKLLFNPDTFTARYPETLTEEDQQAKEQDQELVRALSTHLHDVVIPRLVEDLRESNLVCPMDSAALSVLLHKRGINLRCLGEVLRLAEAETKASKCTALVQVARRSVVARAVKHLLSKALRAQPFALMRFALSHFLNCLLSDKADVVMDAEVAELFKDALDLKQWTPASVQAQVEKEVARRYRYTLPEDWASSMSGMPLLREICLAFGIQLAARDYFPSAQLETNGHAETEARTATAAKKSKKAKKEAAAAAAAAEAPRTQLFMPEDILAMLPVLKDSAPRSGLAEEAMEAGRLSISQGQKELGMELLAESMSLHEQIYGVLHPEAARGYHNLSHFYGNLEDKTLAADLSRKAVIVGERTLGLDSHETVLFYLNLALFEHANGATKQALAYIEHALAKWRFIYGGDHPDMITTMNNTAIMLQSLRLFADSAAWFRRTADVCVQVYGPESLNAASVFFQLAQAMAMAGQHRESIGQMRDAFNIFKRELGADSKNTKEAEFWLSQLTQNAVQLAKQARLDATRSAAVMGRSTSLASRVAATQQMNAETAAINKKEGTVTVETVQPLKNVSSKSVEELVRYITGADPVEAPKKNKSKKSRPMKK